MLGSFITRGLVMVFGYAYPAYECFKTVEKNKPEIEQLRFWCQYWILVAVLTVFERVGDTFVSWIPMYSEAKLAFFIYLWHPKTKGTSYVYDSFFHSYVAKHETDIDRSILELRTRAGDIAIQYWLRAASYGQIVFEVLQYVASQSTSRPRPAQQATGARQPPPTAPPPTLRPRQPAATQQQQPPTRTTSTASTQQQQVPSRSSSTASLQQPPSLTSSTGTTQQKQEPAQDKVPAPTNSAPSAAAVPTGADQPVAKLSSQSSQSEAELMEMEIASSSLCSLLAEPQVYGRDEDSVKLVNQFSGSNQENISVFSAGGCIRRVPTKFREINEYAYTPEVISIGPFHRDKMDLKEMEVHKLQYVNSLLSRFEDRATKLEECVEAISRLEDEARKCYSEPIELNKEEFIELMIVDGIFIIELFRKNAGKGQIDKDDPIFNNVWGLASLVRDLILFENQLPMLVLERLFKITMASQQGVKQLSELAIRFFNPLMQREESVLAKYFETGGDHLLDLLSKTFYDFPSQQLPHGVKSVQVPVPTVWMEREEIVVERAPSQGEISTSSTVKSEPQLEFKDVPSLTKLRDSGVKFKKGNNTHSFLDINFSNGVIEIPPILIRDQNFSFIRNVIAYEHGLVGHPAQMTSYVVFMNNLIQSSNDVAFLRGHGIIRNYLSDDELVSSQFQKLRNEINLANFHHSKLCIDVNAFRVTYIQKATSVLKNVYRRM